MGATARGKGGLYSAWGSGIIRDQFYYGMTPGKMPLRYSRQLLVLITALFAAVTRAEATEWHQLSADGFPVMGDVSDRKLQHAADQVAMFRTVVGRFILAGNGGQDLPIRVYAVSEDVWKQYLRPREGVVGYFVPSPFGADIVIDADQDLDQSGATVYHEYTHFFVHSNDKFPYPVWFSEGLAEMMGSLHAGKGKLYAGSLPEGGWLYLTDGSWIPFSKVLSATLDSPEYIEHKAAPQFYAESLLLTHYMIIGGPPEQRARLNMFLQKLVVERLDADAATRAALGITLAQLEQNVRGYYKHGHFLAMVMADPRDSHAAGKFPIVTLPAVQGWDEIGHLILRSHMDPDRAVAAFQKVIGAEPANRRALAGTAMALETKGPSSEADPWLKRFAEVSSPLGLPDRYCGEIYEMRMRQTDGPSSAEDLRKSSRNCFDVALQADPGDMYALVELTGLVASDRNESERLLPQLAVAISKYPQSEYLAMALSQALWSVGRRSESLAYLRRGIESTRDIDQRRKMTAAYERLRSQSN
jgi:hypothetical protein